MYVLRGLPCVSTGCIDGGIFISELFDRTGLTRNCIYYTCDCKRNYADMVGYIHPFSRVLLFKKVLDFDWNRISLLRLRDFFQQIEKRMKYGRT